VRLATWMASNSFSPTRAGHLEFSGPDTVYGDEKPKAQINYA